MEHVMADPTRGTGADSAEDILDEPALASVGIDPDSVTVAPDNTPDHHDDDGDDDFDEDDEDDFDDDEDDDGQQASPTEEDDEA
jgi:hypothetical protein